MARPKRPGRSRTVRTWSTDVRLFLRLINADKVFGTHRLGIFHGAGIQAMYQMRLTDIKTARGIGEKEDWLDRQGVEELAANEFRITQTEAKIRRENIVGELLAINAHAK